MPESPSPSPPSTPADDTDLKTLMAYTFAGPERKGEDGTTINRICRLSGIDPPPVLAHGISLGSATGSPLKGIPVTDNYRVSGELSRGGMGRILRGLDLNLGREVALKVLLARSRENPAMVERFVREAQIAGSLQHPGVVPVYELGLDEDDQPFFAMKLVEGHTLREILAMSEPPAGRLPSLLDIFGKTCQTIAYAHARKVVHRDLKPDNIMVGAYGEVLVMDWGLAKVLDQPEEETPAAADSPGTEDPEREDGHSQAGSVLGTPSYMAPEQARGEVDRIDERADVFSLGAILLEILTGSPPYTGSTAAEVKAAAAAGEVGPALARLGEHGIERELVDLVRDCLAPDQEDRLRHGGEVADRFSHYTQALEKRSRQAELAAAEARARADEAGRRMAQERRARRLTTVLAGMIVLILLVGGGTILWIRAERQSRRTRTERAIGEALGRARELQAAATAGARPDVGRLEAALAATGKATLLAASGSGFPELLAQAKNLSTTIQDERERIREKALRDRQDREMLDRLEEIGFRHFDNLHERRTGRYDWDREAQAYARAFKGYGLDLESLPPTGSADRIGKNRNSLALLLGLHNWIRALKKTKKNADRQEQVFALACPRPWRGLLTGGKDPSEWARFAKNLALDRTPPRILAVFLGRYGRAGDPAAVEPLLRQAQDRHPQDPWIQACCGSYYRHTADPPRPAQAAAAYRAALAARPDCPAFWHQLAWILIDRGEGERGIAYLHRLVELKPELPWALIELGNGYKALGRMEEALDRYGQALRLDPEEAEAHHQRGVLLVELGRLQEGREALLRATKAAPHMASAWANLGAALERLDRLPQAAEACRRAIREDPEFAGAHYNLGIILRKLGESPGALQAFRQAVALDSEEPDYVQKLGRVLWAGGDLEEARYHLQRALKLAPGRIRTRWLLGNTLLQLGDLPAATTCLQEVLRRDPDMPAALIDLGICLGMRHQYARAAATLEHLLELGKGGDRMQATAKGNLAFCRQMLELSRALPAFLDGSRKPSSLEEEVVIGRLLHGKGEHREAARFIRRALEKGLELSRPDLGTVRLEGARSAIHAGRHHRGEEDEAPDPEKVELLMWALKVLRGELAHWRQEEDRRRTYRHLVLWLEHPALRSLRREPERYPLTRPQRARWTRFWQEVVSLVAANRPFTPEDRRSSPKTEVPK